MGSRLGWARMRRVAMVAALVTAGAGVSAPEAAGAGHYAWLNCSSFDRVAAEPGVAFWRNGGLPDRSGVRSANPNWSWQIRSIGPAGGAAGGSVVWNAPPGTLIRSIELSIDARSADHNNADLTIHTPGAGRRRGLPRAGRAGRVLSHSRDEVSAQLGRGPSLLRANRQLPQSERAHIWMREVVVTLEDLNPPRLALEPELAPKPSR